MDFRWTKEQEAFRQEVREWLMERMRDVPENQKSGWFALDEPSEEGYEVAKRIQADLVKKGWLALGWPKKHGGAGMGAVEQSIFAEEWSLLRVPKVYGGQVSLLGPMIMAHGTEELKRTLLPRILRGEVVSWNVYTEPGGGSDLAALKTRARKDGDSYIVNGAKIFVGDSHTPDYMYLMVRTDPDAPLHQGVSAFVMPAKIPGVTIRQLEPLAGARKNAVFFDDARVPASHLLGEENKGWELAMTSLRGLGGGGGGNVLLQRFFEEVVKYCKTQTHNDKPLIADPLIAQRLGELAMRLHTMRLMGLRSMYMRLAGKPMPHAGNLNVLLGKQFHHIFASLLLEIVQHGGVVKEGGPGSALDGLVQHYQLAALQTHTHGTIEITKSMIARRGLGLPRPW